VKTPKQLLQEAIAAGATFSDFLGLYAKKNTDQDEAIIAAAREKWQEGGQIEIDDTTICSGSDGPGDYVLAWVWVYFDKEMRNEHRSRSVADGLPQLRPRRPA
jgi:hypothetical protein